MALECICDLLFWTQTNIEKTNKNKKLISAFLPCHDTKTMILAQKNPTQFFKWKFGILTYVAATFVAARKAFFYSQKNKWLKSNQLINYIILCTTHQINVINQLINK